MSNFAWPRDNAELLAQLTRQRDRYEQLLNNMSDLLMLIEPDGTVSFCSRRAGPPAGGAAADFVDPADRAAFAAAIEQVRCRRLAVRELLFQVGDGGGGKRIIEGTLTPVTEGEQVVQIQLLGRDVTDRHQAAEALRQANISLTRRQSELQRDLDVAAKIHRSLLPPPLETEQVRIDLKHVPLLGLGGDYVYIHRADLRQPAMVMFDVSGHGVASALVANRVHSAVYAIMNQGSPPPQMIARLNRFIHDSFVDLGIYVTLFALQLDPQAGSACYCGAGHPPALLKRAATGQVTQLQSQHLPLGVAPDVFVGEPASRVQVAPGDTIWVYTDGLIELQTSEQQMLGVQGLAERVKGFDVSDPQMGLAESCLQSILGDFESPDDDLTLSIVAIR